MNTLNVKRLGLAVGAAAAVLYIGCALIMATVPHEPAVWFFNSMTHGVDWGPIMRWDMPLWEALIGVLEVFVLGWLVGAFVAVLYNLGAEEGGPA